MVQSMTAESVVKMDKEILFHNANSILKRLLVGHSDNNDLLVDMSGLVHCDSAGIAVFLEAKKHFLRKNNKITFVNVPQQVIDLSTFLKVEKVLFN